MGAGRSRAADFSPDVGPDGRAAPARGGAATDAANYRVGPPPATAAAPSITVVCPSCRATLIPPAELFTCPCGLLIQLAPQSLAHGFMPPELDGPIAAHYSALLREIARRGGLGIGVHGGGGGGRPPGLSLPMPQVVRDNFDSRYLLGLITQLPSDDYGRPHPEAYAALMNKLERAIKGAPKQLIERLPTREWEPPPSSATLSEDACTCGVCLAPYERGEILRTLPCLHTFHSTCVDPWLEGNRCCPNCRFDIATESTRALGELRGGDGAAGASALGGAVSGVTSAGGINAAGGGAGGGAAGGGAPPPRQILGGISASSYSTPPPSAAGGISAANYSAPPPGAAGGSIPGAFR